MIYLYHKFIAYPLYNGFIYLFDVIPWLDAGMAVILFTIIIKLILFPLAKKSIVTQLMMKKIEPELKLIREKFKGDNQKQASETLVLYRKYGVNPFSSFLLILIQLPILIALYSIFYSYGLPEVKLDLLYSFVQAPVINMHFLGILDIAKSSVILAILASISQYYQIKLSVPTPPPRKDGEKPNFQEEMARSMGTNMKYIFPIMVFFLSYKFSAALPLYWTVSNLFMIGQELFVKRKLEKKINGVSVL
ncbi:MAG: YidC/Oxa1 family membrane protein insertase [bacterium]|nr:YidC/Oxa1 family membrane protein insertase [bacterium]